MTYYEIRFAWNAQADDGNRWHSLSVPEKIEWAAIHAAAKERAARQAAQEEAEDLKDRIARAGVEQRRAVRKAALQEREECAKACEQQRFGIDAFGSIDHHVRQAAEQCAAAIRARQ